MLRWTSAMRLFRFCWCAEHVIQFRNDRSDISLEIVMPGLQGSISRLGQGQVGFKSGVKMRQLLGETGDSPFEPQPSL